MKNIKTIIIAVALVFGVLCFAQCKKDHTCKMRVTCYYSLNGMAPDTICPNATVKFDVSKYQNGTVDTALYLLSDTLANDKGIYEFSRTTPALLVVVANKTDSVRDESGNVIEVVNWAGTTQVELKEGETVEKSLLLVRVN